MSDLTTEDVFGPEVKGKREPEPIEAKEPEEKPEPQEEPKADEPTEPAAKEQPEPEQQDTGVEAPPPGESTPPKGFVPLAAVEDERRKRQEFERRVQEYERREREQQTQQQRIPPQFRDDPEAYLNQVILNERMNLSREMAMSAHPDYQEMEDYLVERTNVDPALAAQVHVGLQSTTNPAKFAYDTAKRLKREEEWQQHGGYDKWLEQERERIRKEYEASLPKAQPTPSPEAPPESLAASPSTVSKSDTFKKPSSNEIFN